MSKGQTLRALVNERLTAAADEIFALFERTIAEYEEEMCHYKEETQRKQQRLDSTLMQKNVPDRGEVQIPSASPDPGLNREITETPQIKEEPDEHSVKQEEQLTEPIPEFNVVCVKSEESSPLHDGRTEPREETQEEDFRPETHFHSETEGDTEHSSDWGLHFSGSTAQMETEADGHSYSQDSTNDRSTGAQNSHLFPQNQSAPGTSASVNYGDTPAYDKGDEWKKHQCPVCNKRFKRTDNLQTHRLVHVGETPYSCSLCDKTFKYTSNLKRHMRSHTDERPYSCSICDKTFMYTSALKIHMRTHTGEKPYSCSLCDKTFKHSPHLKIHMRTHTGEKPYSCSICDKTFRHMHTLKTHIVRTHASGKTLQMFTL